MIRMPERGLLIVWRRLAGDDNLGCFCRERIRHAEQVWLVAAAARAKISEILALSINVSACSGVNEQSAENGDPGG